MFPEPEHGPTLSFEGSSRVNITTLIPFEFPIPPVRIGAGPDPVIGAPVPKAAVDEYGNS